MNVGLFCSSCEQLAPSFQEEARQLGQWIAKQEHTLIYGGSTQGLMGICAQAVHQHKGRTIGIVPSFLHEMSLTNAQDTERIYVDDLAERKRKMIATSDCFVVLPGGIGSLDELFSVYASAIVGEHNKPLYLINTNELYTPLITQIKQFKNANLLHPNPYTIQTFPSIKEWVKEINKHGKNA